MQGATLIELARENIGTLIIGGLFAAALAFLGFIVTEPNFRVTSEYLIVQNSEKSQDFYTLFKSSEYLGNVLSEAVYSEQFINEAEKLNKFDKSTLSGVGQTRLNAWKNIVHVSHNVNIGSLQVEVLNDDRRQAQNISDAVGSILTQKNTLFHGGKQGDVEIRLITGPIIHQNPSLGEIAIVTVAGFLFGVLLALVLLYFRTGERKNFEF